MLKPLLQAVVTIIFIVILFPGPVSAESARSLVKSGNEAFSRGDYAGSLKHYEEAAAAAPDSAIILFNKGDALYKQEKYEEALQAFERAAAKASQNKDRQLETRSFYNMGNSAYRSAEKFGSENLEQALNEFKKSSDYFQSAVKLDPGLSEAAQNLESSRLATKRIEELIRKQQQQARQQKQQREDLAKELDNLKQEQQSAAEDSRDLTGHQGREGPGDEAERQAGNQKLITGRTRQAAADLEKLDEDGRSGDSDEISREHVKSAIEKQEEAEKKLLSNKPDEAHEDQQQAARELQKALSKLEQGKNDEEGQEGGDREEAGNKAGTEGQEQRTPAKDTGQSSENVQGVSGRPAGESPEDIINEEIEHSKFRGTRNATGYKPVDKDW